MPSDTENTTAAKVAQQLLEVLDAFSQAIVMPQSGQKFSPEQTEQAASAIKQLAEARALLLKHG